MRRLLDQQDEPAPGNQRLLIIDDDPGVCEFVREVAKGEGYDVKIITGSGGFLQAYESFQPTTIMLDIIMPEVDGIELLRRLADLKCRSRIVAVSGYSEAYVRHAKLLGEAYGLANIVGLTKPFQVESLRRALQDEDAGAGASTAARA